MPTVTGCVKSNPYTPGPNGEVHSGALTIYIVKAGAPASAIALNVAGHPESGYKVIDDSWVLKLYTVFWHTGVCYGQSGWIPNPPSDYTGGTVTGQTPAPGSDDPTGVVKATVVSTSTTVTTTGTGNNKLTTTTTTTNYSDGSMIVVAVVTDSKGHKKSSTTTAVPPGQGGNPPGQQNKVASSSPPPPRTGYNQSRLSGKIGRVAWHEVIKD
jgi:hypothetical protein